VAIKQASGLDSRLSPVSFQYSICYEVEDGTMVKVCKTAGAVHELLQDCQGGGGSQPCRKPGGSLGAAQEEWPGLEMVGSVLCTASA